MVLFVTTDRPVKRLNVTAVLPAGLSLSLHQELVGDTGTVHRVNASVKGKYPSSRAEGKLNITAEGPDRPIVVPILFAAE